MKAAITAYHQDEHQDWVAELSCGHFQHVRHHPPFICRPWVIETLGREKMLGHPLNCVKCDQSLPADIKPHKQCKGK